MKINPLIHIYIYYVMFSLFIIPINTIPHLAFFVPIFFSLFLFYNIYNNYKFNYFDILLSLTILMNMILNHNFYVVTQSFFLIIMMILFKCYRSKYFDISKKEVWFIYTISFFSIIIQLLLFRSGGEVERTVMGIGDPNFSALIMLLFLFFCHKMNFKSGILLSLITILLLQSRIFLIAVLIFYLVRYSKKYLYKIFEKTITFEVLFFVGNALVLILSFYWIKNLTAGSKYIYGVGRLLKYIDYANYGRFMANIVNLRFLCKEPYYLLFGIPNLEWSLKNVFNLPVPHNSLLYCLEGGGIIFTIINFVLIYKLINRLTFYENYEYLASYFVFSYFLHGLFSGYFFVPYLVILMIKENMKNAI